MQNQRHHLLLRVLCLSTEYLSLAIVTNTLVKNLSSVPLWLRFEATSVHSKSCFPPKCARNYFASPSHSQRRRKEANIVPHFFKVHLVVTESFCWSWKDGFVLEGICVVECVGSRGRLHMGRSRYSRKISHNDTDESRGQAPIWTGAFAFLLAKVVSRFYLFSHVSSRRFFLMNSKKMAEPFTMEMILDGLL